MLFSKNIFFAFMIHSIYFSEGAQLNAEVAKSQFLLTAFISKQAFFVFVCLAFIFTCTVRMKSDEVKFHNKLTMHKGMT